MTRLQEILETYPAEEFIKADGFDDAVIGVEANSLRLVYCIEMAIDILIEEGMTEEDAIEHLFYNTIGSYVGEKTPIWINMIA